MNEMQRYQDPTTYQPTPYVQPAQPMPAANLVVTDRRPVHGVVLGIAWTSAVLTLGYMLPWAIAASRGKSNQAAIGLINFFLGWSGVGWIVAMVMACQAHQAAGLQAPSITNQLVVARDISGVVSSSQPGAGWYPSPDGFGSRWWDGQRWSEYAR